MRFLGYDVPIAVIGIVVSLIILNFIADVVNKKINSIVRNKILIERDIHKKQIEELKQKDIDTTNYLKEIANLQYKVNALTKEQETQASQMKEQKKNDTVDQASKIEEQSSKIEEQGLLIEELIKEVNQKDKKTIYLLRNVAKLQDKIILLTEELYSRQKNNMNTNNQSARNNYKITNHSNHSNHGNHSNHSNHINHSNHSNHINHSNHSNHSNHNNNYYNEDYYYYNKDNILI